MSSLQINETLSTCVGVFLLLVAGCGEGNENGPDLTGGPGNGEGNWPSVQGCTWECESATDCPEEGEFVCENGACKADICSSNAECTPVLSSWSGEGCSTGGCDDAGTCVRHNETTYCAIEEPAGGCRTGSSIEKEKADGTGTVTICARTGFCRRGACKPDSDSRLDVTCSDRVCDGPGGSCEFTDPLGAVCTCSPGECNEGFTCASL